MQPLGETLRRLNPEPVDEQLLGELAVALEALDPLGDLRPDRHPLECDHVTLRRFGAFRQRPEDVAEADPVVLWLAREDEPLELETVVVGVEDDQHVAVGVAREVPDPRPRVQVVLLGFPGNLEYAPVA
jgi:hypothetical protein